MICGIFHQGSGLGNQLFRYVATRVVAAEKGYEWGMVVQADGSGKELGFKGSSFMQIDMGKNPMLLPVVVKGMPITAENITYGVTYPSPFLGKTVKKWNEKKIIENGIDVRGYDPEFNFVEDYTVIDGEFQDPRYFEHRLDEVREWLEVEPLEMPDDLCVIGFRGGEYALYPDLFLTKDYWDTAIGLMKEKNPTMRFEVHTDDLATAKQFFPDFECIHDIGLNWRSVRYAKYLIIANSSFYILPSLLNQNLKAPVIAPRFWGRRNTKVWALPQNYYRQFFYI